MSNTVNNGNSVLIYLRGKRGSGKNTRMAWEAEEQLNDAQIKGESKKIIANFELNRKYFPDYIYMKWEDIIKLPEELSDALVLVDETAVGANARNFNSKSNKKMLEFVTQIRKRNCDLMLAGQTLRMADVGIRDQIDYIVECANLGNQIHAYIWRDRQNWDMKDNIVLEEVINCRTFFLDPRFDTNEIITMKEEGD